MVLYSRYPVRFDISNSAIREKHYVSPPESALDAPRDWLHRAPKHEARTGGATTVACGFRRVCNLHFGQKYIRFCFRNTLQ